MGWTGGLAGLPASTRLLPPKVCAALGSTDGGADGARVGVTVSFFTPVLAVALDEGSPWCFSGSPVSSRRACSASPLAGPRRSGVRPLVTLAALSSPLSDTTGGNEFAGEDWGEAETEEVPDSTEVTGGEVGAIEAFVPTRVFARKP